MIDDEDSKLEESGACACGSTKTVGLYRWTHKLGLYPEATGWVCEDCLRLDAEGFVFTHINQQIENQQLFSL